MKTTYNRSEILSIKTRLSVLIEKLNANNSTPELRVLAQNLNEQIQNYDTVLNRNY
jgi:hypothetical protein